MSEVNPEAGGTPPEATPTPAPAPEAPTLTPEAVDAWLRENQYIAYKNTDPRLARLDEPEPAPAPAPSMPNVPDYDPYDPNSVARIVQDQTKDLPVKVAEDVVAKVLDKLNPLLNSFASAQVNQGVREEAKPYIGEIMKEFNFTPFQLAQDPKVMKLVNEAATARAIAAGKVAQSILFPSDPPGGGGSGGPTAGEDAQLMIRQSEAFLGRALTEDEKKVYVAEFELSKKREGLGV